MELPINFDEASISIDDEDVHKLKALINDDIPFPSTSKNSIILHGKNGTGKTLLSSILPILIEHERADTAGKANYNFCYDFKGKTTSITPNNTGKKKLEADINLLGCGSSERQETLARFEKMISGSFHSYIGSLNQYFILDEVDLLKSHQAALKTLLSTEYPYAIFIMTTNHIDKVESGLKSRAHQFYVDFSDTSKVLPIVRRSYGFETTTDEVLIDLLAEADGDLREVDDICNELKFTLSSTDSGK